MGTVTRAGSLVDFGMDSGIEVASATVVPFRLPAELRADDPEEAKERRSLKFIALTVFALTARAIVEGVRDLVTGRTPDTSIAGIALTGLPPGRHAASGEAKRRAGLIAHAFFSPAQDVETVGDRVRSLPDARRGRSGRGTGADAFIPDPDTDIRVVGNFYEQTVDLRLPSRLAWDSRQFRTDIRTEPSAVRVYVLPGEDGVLSLPKPTPNRRRMRQRRTA